MDVVFLIIGAVLGLFFDKAYDAIRKNIHRRNPLQLEVVRSKTPPSWFATNENPPDEISDGAAYEERIVENAAFCGFAKINLHITNKSDEVVYITNIDVSKEEITSKYKYRVRTISQGASSAIRLVACLDDRHCFMASSLSKRNSKNGNYFECGERIKVAPGETEYMFLAFAAINQSWSFNCDLAYSINGTTRRIEHIFEKDQTIVPYIPELFEIDYCSFLKSVDPSYIEFDDAQYFTADMRNVEMAEYTHTPSSALAYIEGEIE